MTGSDIKQLRQSLDMHILDFTDLVGVAISTMYRWEATPSEIRMEGHPLRLLTLMHTRMAQGPHMRSAVLEAIQGRSGLERLHRLLGVLLG